MPKRLDAEDVAEFAVHTLHRLCAEGWIVEDVETHVDHETTHKGGRKLPVGATVTIKLVPVRDR